MATPIFEMVLTAPNTAVSATAAARSGALDWHTDHHEGQLAIDVVDVGGEIVVVSTMAGAKTNRVEVTIHNDLLTVRGVRISPITDEGAAYLHQECYWGKFSRTVVLPMEVKGELARAELKNGVLEIRIPKRETKNIVPVTIIDE